MRPATLEAWQVYAARCRRLDAEEAKEALPWWKVLSPAQIAGIALVELASLALLARLAGLI